MTTAKMTETRPSDLAVVGSPAEGFVAVRDERHSVTIQSTAAGLRVTIFEGDNVVLKWEAEEQPRPQSSPLM